MENVTDQPPEGEPEIRHYTEAGDPRTWCGVSLADVTVGAVTRDRSATTCPGCTAVLVDAHLFDDDRRAPACPHGYDAEDACEGCTPPSAAEPERRTVSLEVLTDQLRADEDDRRREAAHEASKMRVDGETEKPILLPAAARVGIVLRLDGEAVLVPETDGMWLASFRQPADVLAQLLRQARFYADDHDDAELLMPTPDVLAALAGTPDARLLTVPVHVLAMDIQAGMLLYATDDDGDGAETLELVTAADDCTGPDCVNGVVCAVLTVPGGGFEDPVVHFNAYSRLQVRIPADQAVTR